MQIPTFRAEPLDTEGIKFDGRDTSQTDDGHAA